MHGARGWRRVAGWGGLKVEKSRLAFSSILRRAGATLRRLNVHARAEKLRASIRIPVEGEDPVSFIGRVASLLQAPGSFVYIDTSFLMWLIKVGHASREEFATWLRQTCANRIGVPTWSLHELYRHHAGKRVIIDLDEHIKKLGGIVSESFPMFWTLFDEPLNGATSVAQQREQAREALRAVRTLTNRASSWTANYERNAREVIEFANAHAMSGGKLFDRFPTIEDTAEARFTGRIPPGFQDKRKKVSGVEAEDGNAIVEGSNRWGDLVFWQEILDHARATRVRNVIILTKDMKSDWRMAGSLAAPASAKGDASVIQPAHPMLSLEAALTAGVSEVLLLDQSRLADVMKASSGDVANYVAVARPPSLPLPKTDAELRGEAREREESDRSRVAQGIARAANLRFLDPTGLEAKRAGINRAVFDTRDDSPLIAEVIALEATVQRSLGARDIADLLTVDVALALKVTGLVGFARRLLTAAEADGERAAAAADLVAALGTFPPAVAASLYAGFLAATYLDGRSRLRGVPLRLVAQKLFAFQHMPWASLPMQEICHRAAKAEQKPLYLPSAERPPIVVQFEIDTELDRPNALRSIWVHDHDLLIDVQADPALQLERRMRGVPLTPELALDHIAELYVLPRRQLGPGGTLIDVYTLDEHIGFRAPQDVWNQGRGEA